MYTHAAETYVTVANAANVAEKICKQIQGFCLSITTEESNTFLTFDDGCAILRPTDHGLFFRVSAHDLVVFQGIRTIIEGSLSSFIATSEDPVQWLQADETPFHSIGKIAATDRRHRIKRS